MEIAVIGASGFVGSEIANAALDAGHNVIATYSTGRVAQDPARRSLRTVKLDITSSADVFQFFDKHSTIDVVVLACSYLGSDRGLAKLVNEDAAMTVIRALESNKCWPQLVKTSNTSVYEDGPVSGKNEMELSEAATTYRSETRLRGDRIAIAYGGWVLRPHLVLGTNDSWVTPNLRTHGNALMRNNIRNRKHSCIEVRRLAQDTIQIIENGRGRGAVIAAGQDPKAVSELVSLAETLRGAADSRILAVHDLQRVLGQDRWFNTRKFATATRL